MKKRYKTPSILWLDMESEYGYCQEIPIVDSNKNATSDNTGTGGDDYSDGFVKTITMDHSDDEW